MIGYGWDSTASIRDNVDKIGLLVAAEHLPVLLQVGEVDYLFDGNSTSKADNLAGLAHRAAEAILASVSGTHPPDEIQTIAALADCNEAMIESIRIKHGRSRADAARAEVAAILRSDTPLPEAVARSLQTLQYLTGESARRSRRHADSLRDPAVPLTFEPQAGANLPKVADKLVKLSRFHKRLVRLKFGEVTIGITPEKDVATIRREHQAGLEQLNFMKRQAPTGL